MQDGERSIQVHVDNTDRNLTDPLSPGPSNSNRVDLPTTNGNTTDTNFNLEKRRELPRRSIRKSVKEAERRKSSDGIKIHK